MATVKIPFPIQVVQKVGRKRNDILSSVTNFALPETEKRFRNIFFFHLLFLQAKLTLTSSTLDSFRRVKLCPSLPHIFSPLFAIGLRLLHYCICGVMSNPVSRHDRYFEIWQDLQTNSKGTVHPSGSSQARFAVLSRDYSPLTALLSPPSSCLAL